MVGLDSAGTLTSHVRPEAYNENSKFSNNVNSRVKKSELMEEKYAQLFQSQLKSQPSQSGGQPWSRNNSKLRKERVDISDYDSVVDNVLRASRAYRQKKELHKQLVEVERRKRDIRKLLEDI